MPWGLFVGLVRRLAKGVEGVEEERTKRNNMKIGIRIKRRRRRRRRRRKKKNKNKKKVNTKDQKKKLKEQKIAYYRKHQRKPYNNFHDVYVCYPFLYSSEHRRFFLWYNSSTAVLLSNIDIA